MKAQMKKVADIVKKRIKKNPRQKKKGNGNRTSVIWH